MPPTPGTNRDDPNRNHSDNEDIEYMDTPQFIIAAESSEEDSDDGMGDNGGYQMLAQEPPEAGDSDDHIDVEMMDEGAAGGGGGSDVPDFGKVGLGSDFQVPEIANSEAEDRRTIWQEVKTDHEPLEQEQVDKIKSAMSSITLPKLNIPDWARVVPEEEWKNRLFSRLHQNVTTPAVTATVTSSTEEQQQQQSEAPALSPTTENLSEDSKSDSEDKT